jgi:hypothetical protein
VQGPAGQQGPVGARGSTWFTGHGVPTGANTAGSVAGDKYLDVDTGDIYNLT